MFQTLVIQYRLVSMEYFMDQLQDWEVYDIYNTLQYADASQWEQTRWLMYVIAQVNSRKHLKLSDILQFPWDSEATSGKTISNEDVERLRKKAKIIESNLLKEAKNGSDTKRNNKT